MKRLAYIVISLAITLCAVAAKPKRTSSDARTQRKQTEQQIAKTTKKITLTEAEITKRLGRINTLEQGIQRSQANELQLKQRLDSVERQTALVKDSIAVNEASLAQLRSTYVAAVRSSRRNRRELNTVTFLFSAETFRQASRRMDYLAQFSRWRQRKASEIQDVSKRLQGQREQLEQMSAHISSLRSQTIAEQRRLKAGRDSVRTVVNSLQGEKKKLSALLKKQQTTLRNLDAEIDRLIAQEAEAERRRQAEEAKRRAQQAQQQAEAADPANKAKSQPSKEPAFTPSAPVADTGGDFASRRGKLPAPLSHTYVVARPFGVQPHKTHTNVEVNNPGIDLETAPGATARAVHPGRVSAVFLQDGYGHVVLVRHGSYITVYANIKSIKVKKGDTLAAGDAIGTVATSEDNPQRGMLHFEIRNEREKLNPAVWLKR